MKVISRALRTINLKLFTLVLPLLVGMSGSPLMSMEDSVALRAIEQSSKPYSTVDRPIHNSDVIGNIPMLTNYTYNGTSTSSQLNSSPYGQSRPLRNPDIIPTAAPLQPVADTTHTDDASKPSGWSFSVRVGKDDFSIPRREIRERDLKILEQPMRDEIKANPYILLPNAYHINDSVADTKIKRAASDALIKKYIFIKKCIFEPLLRYNSFSALGARALLMQGKNLVEDQPRNSYENKRLHEAYDDITRIICNADGTFKQVGSLTKQELDTIARIYAEFLYGDEHELSLLIPNNPLFVDLIKEYKDKSNQSQIAKVASDVQSFVAGGIKGALNFYNKVPMSAWSSKQNIIANCIVDLVKQGHYALALERGEKTGYFKHRPIEADLIKKECHRLLTEQKEQDLFNRIYSDADQLKLVTNYVMDRQKELLEAICQGYTEGKCEFGTEEYRSAIERRAQALKDILHGDVLYTNQTYPLTTEQKELIAPFAIPADSIGTAYGNPIQHAVYNEVQALLKHATTTKKDYALVVDDITTCALSAWECARIGDIKAALDYTDKGWKYVYADVKKPLFILRPLLKEPIVFTADLLKKAHEHSLKKEPFDLTSLKQEQSLFPEAEQFLKDHGVKPEEFIKSIDATLDQETAGEIILRCYQDASLKFGLGESDEELETVNRIVSATYEKVIANIKDPYTFVKRSFVDPIVSTGTSLGDFLKKHGSVFIDSQILDMQREHGQMDPELQKKFEDGFDILASNTIQSIVSIPAKTSEALKAINKLPQEQKEELIADIVSNLITARVFGSALSVFKHLDKIKTGEKILELVDEARQARIIDVIYDKATNTYRVLEEMETIASGVPAVKTGTAITTLVQEGSGTSQIGQKIAKGAKIATTGAEVSNTAQDIGKAGNAAIKTEQAAQEGSTISGATKIGETGTIVDEIPFFEKAGKKLVRDVPIDQTKSGIIKECEITKKSYEHIFSDPHINEGKIMELGKNKADILDKFIDIAIKADQAGLLKEESNQIETIIKGCDAVIRVRVEKGKVLSVNAFKGETTRKIGNTVKFVVDDYA